MYQDHTSSRNLNSVISLTSSCCSKSRKILIAEDESDVAALYKKVLENRNHQVTITINGEDCLKTYHEVCQSNRYATEQKQSASQSFCSIRLTNSQSFDIVLLDCNMPYINGIEVAKEILAVNPHQRIIFASAYIKDSIVDLVRNLKRHIESIQKPFGMQKLVDLIEDKEIYHKLQKFNVDLEIVRAMNPSHEQIMDLLNRLQNVHNTDFNENENLFFKEDEI